MNTKQDQAYSAQSQSSDDQCPSCLTAGSLHLFFRNLSTPADCGFLPASKEKARECQNGPVEMVFCDRCGLIFNRRFDRRLIQFSPGYEVSLEYSAQFRKHIDGLVQRLIQQFELTDKKILEIGCGNGRFLNQLCRTGNNRGIGIDPAIPNDPEAAPGVEFVRDFFSDKYSDLKCDFICSLSVLEDIDQLNVFLKNVHKIAVRNDTAVHFEVFNGWRTFECNEVWSIHFEQCNYFSKWSLENTIRAAGFEITQSSTCYGKDQYLFIEAIASESEQPLQRPSLECVQKVKEFPQNFDRRKRRWQDQLNEIDGGVVLWGAGGKGITFLNSIDSSETVDAVVDINPRRQWRFIPGTGHPIIGPQQLGSFNPELVIIANELYRSEISQQLNLLGLNPKIEVL